MPLLSSVVIQHEWYPWNNFMYNICIISSRGKISPMRSVYETVVIRRCTIRKEMHFCWFHLMKVNIIYVFVQMFQSS